MILLLRIFLYLVLLLLCGYSLLRYFHLWNRIGIKGTVGSVSKSLLIYLLIQIVFLVNLVLCQYMAAWISWEPLLYSMQAVSCIYFSILLYSPVFCFVRGIIRFLGKHNPFYRKREIKGRIYRYFNHPAKSIYIILGITACAGIAAFCHAHHLEIQEYHVAIEKTAGQESMSIALISDLHLGTSMTRNGLEQLVQKVNEQSPDVIVMCGGTIDRNTSEEWKKYGAEQLSKLKASYGIFCVEGEDEDDIAEWFRDAGITMLRDQRVQFMNGVQMVGLCDQTNPRKRDVAEVISNLDEESPILVLTHRPEQLSQIAGLGADLVLCGHILSGAYPLEPVLDGITGDMLYGVEKFGSMTAVTTSGVGRYGIPSRLLPPSEIVFIQLTFMA